MARDGQEFERRLNVLCDNFGWAGPEFVRRLTKELERDHAGEQTSRSSIRAIADELHKKYWNQAADIKSRGGRDLTRITDQFATIYVAGCLAIQFKILPFTETEVRLWLLICQRDSVAFVDRQLGAWGRRQCQSTALRPPTRGEAQLACCAGYDPLDRLDATSITIAECLIDIRGASSTRFASPRQTPRKAQFCHRVRR